MTSTTGQEQQGTLELQHERKAAGPVECLGLTFENDQARRNHFLALLKEKLLDPEFRKIPGFPQGTDEAILRMSDPPYYTACPNPFLEEFVKCYGKPYDPEEVYEREPFAVDVSVGKTDQLYKAHGYHTKVPHLAIVPSILHYTKPGDIVLDGFCGSGMTGLAAQWCGTAPLSYRQELEAKWLAEGHEPPEWGARRAVLNDLGPAASFIASGFNLPFCSAEFSAEAGRILGDVAEEYGWMYKVADEAGKDAGLINYTVWSEVFSCPECAGEIVFTEEALDPGSKRVHDQFACPHCGATLNKDRLERSFQSEIDQITNNTRQHVSFRPVIINYTQGKAVRERRVSDRDLDLLARIENLPLPPEVPGTAFPISKMYHGSRLAPKGFTHTHHFFLRRAAISLSSLWRKAQAAESVELRRSLVWFVEQAIWGMSILNRYKTIMHGKTSSSNVNQYLSGVYYIPSQHSEVSPWYNLSNRLERLSKIFASSPNIAGSAMISTGDCARLELPASSVDYIFTDPPFGENLYYADLNFLVESWHGVFTSPSSEAIVDKFKGKDIAAYQSLMRKGFDRYYQVLKPGRWMTVVFSNSKNGRHPDGSQR